MIAFVYMCVYIWTRLPECLCIYLRLPECIHLDAYMYFNLCVLISADQKSSWVLLFLHLVRFVCFCFLLFLFWVLLGEGFFGGEGLLSLFCLSVVIWLINCLFCFCYFLFVFLLFGFGEKPFFVFILIVFLLEGETFFFSLVRLFFFFFFFGGGACLFFVGFFFLFSLRFLAFLNCFC